MKEEINRVARHRPEPDEGTWGDTSSGQDRLVIAIVVIVIILCFAVAVARDVCIQ